MKFLIFFALAFVTVSGLYSRSIEAPVLENEARITNGILAAEGQFKYQVGLDFNKPQSVRWCGGSLIGKEWVLSAAHCTLDALSVTVYLGSTRRRVANKCFLVGLQHIFNHPQWDNSILKNDITLIKIPATNESNRIGIVKIPNGNKNKYLGNSVVVSGWGRTSDDSTLSDDLRYGILKVSPPDTCVESFGLYFSDDVKICVATPNKVSTCNGDSGGALVLKGRNIQIGLFSFFDQTCTERKPIVFTRVSAYRLWIMSKMEPINIQSNYVVSSNRAKVCAPVKHALSN